MEDPTGFEPMLIELQSIALPTWLRIHNLSERYYNYSFIALQDLILVFFTFSFYSPGDCYIIFKRYRDGPLTQSVRVDGP